MFNAGKDQVFKVLMSSRVTRLVWKGSLEAEDCDVLEYYVWENSKGYQSWKGGWKRASRAAYLAALEANVSPEMDVTIEETFTLLD